MSVYMLLGEMEGYLGKKSEFVRPPKFNITAQKPEVNCKKYNRIQITQLLLIESIFMRYGIFQIFYHSGTGDIPMIIFISAFTVGFAYNVFTPIYQSVISK